MAEVRTVNRFGILDNEQPRKPKGPAQTPAKEQNQRRNDNRRGGHGHGRNNNRDRRPRQDVDTTRRQFDRRSGPNRARDTNNRNSAHSWGGDGVADAKTLEGQSATGAAAAADQTPVVEKEVKTEEVEPEPEDNTVTYEEYMEAKKKAFVDAGVEVREVSNDDFKGHSARKFKKAEDAPVLEGIGSRQKKKKNRQRHTKQVLVVNAPLASPNSGGDRRGPRDDRRGGHGGDRRGGHGGDRRGPRDDRRGGHGGDRRGGHGGDRRGGHGGDRRGGHGHGRQQQHINVRSDDSNFPALGSA